MPKNPGNVMETLINWLISVSLDAREFPVTGHQVRDGEKDEGYVAL